MIENGKQSAVDINEDFGRKKTAPLVGNFIRLLTPVEGEITSPLQKAAWPGKDSAGEGSERVDRSIPSPILFTWDPGDCEGAAVEYSLIIDRDARLLEKVVEMHGLVEPRAEVYNLCIGTRYYWKVTAGCAEHGKDCLQAESTVGQFITNPKPPRWINVPGITNVRDIGGYPLPEGSRVRQGMVFRGSEMNGHCSITSEGRNVLTADLGIRTDIDLRGLGEDRKAVLDVRQVVYVNIPIMPYASIARPQFTRHYRSLFNLLAVRANYPVFLHCWGGADRTGTIVFLIQALLGMREEDMFADYELTSLSIWGQRLCGSEAFQDLLQTLELFAPIGSSVQTQVERYLKVIGVTEEEIGEMKRIMVE